MANNYQEGIDKAKQDIDELQGKLIAMQNSILENAKQFNAMLGKGSGSMKQTLETVSKVTKEFDKLNETKKQSIVVDGQIKVKQSELAKSMQALNEQRKKANSERLKEADAIERNKQALQKQKKASIELSRAYVQLVNQHKQAKKTLQYLIVSQGKNSAKTKEAQKEYDRLTKKVNQANQSTQNFAKGGLRSSLSGIRDLLGAFGLIGGVQIFADLIKDAFELTTALDSIVFAMRAVITDATEFGQTQVWLKQITNDYGAELVTTTNRYIKFRAAAKQANFSAKETQGIFGTMTKAAGVLGLKTDELTGIYLALEQMISKGKITTEELRRQLGERLPGAMDIMATSMGVTTAELDRMLRAGEVITKDVLPAFARQVEISFGLDKVEKVVTLRAAITRLKNSWTTLVDDFAKGGTQVKSLTELIDHLSNNFKTYVSVLISATKIFIWYKAMVLASVVQTKALSIATYLSSIKMNLLGKATFSTTKKVVLFNRALKANVLGVVITLLYAAYEAFEYFNKPLGEATKLMKEQTEELKGQTTAYIENRDEVNKMAKAYENLVEKGLERTNEETAEMDRLFIALAKSAPIVVTKTNEFGVATEIATSKLKEFNKEQKASLLASSNVIIKNQTTELKKYTLLQKQLIGFEKEKLTLRTSELGEVIKRNGVYKRYSKWQKKFIDLTLEEKSALADYKLEVRDGLKDSKETIETNKDLIGTITGVLSVRQKEEKALKDKDITDAKEKKALNDKKIVYVELSAKLKKYKQDLKDLGDPKLLPTKDIEKFNELKKSIKDTESEITKLTGATDDGNKSTVKYLKNTMAYYESKISIAKESLKNTAKTEEEWAKGTKAIKDAEDALDSFIRKQLGIGDKGESKGVELPEIKGIDFSDIESTIDYLNSREIDIPVDTTEIDKLIKRLVTVDIAQNAFKDVTDTFSDMFDIDTSKFDFIFDSLKDKSDELFSVDKLGEWADLSKELIGSVLDASMQRYEIELNEAARVRDLTLNNDLASEEAKAKARKKYDKEERKIKKEQAKAEKENTLIKIAMDTAAAVVSIWAQVPKFDYGISAGVLSAATIALGAVQAGIVASQPIPEFFDGVENSSYEGLATKDERGAELHLDKYGNIKDFGQDGGAKYTYVEKGDTIIPAMKTKDILSSFSDEDINRVVFEMNMSSMGSALSENVVDNSLLREISSLKDSNEKVWKEVKKLASRPLNINNKIELKDDRAY